MHKISYIIVLLKNHQILLNSHLKMHFCAVEVSWIYCHRNWDSKVEFKSSKTRLLLFRSGVLMEFKSGVLTYNIRAISGWKLNFSLCWQVVKIDVDWMISGWFLDDFWMISVWFLYDFWMISGLFLDDFCLIFGW